MAWLQNIRMDINYLTTHYDIIMKLKFKHEVFVQFLNYCVINARPHNRIMLLFYVSSFHCINFFKLVVDGPWDSKLYDTLAVAIPKLRTTIDKGERFRLLLRYVTIWEEGIPKFVTLEGV